MRKWHVGVLVVVLVLCAGLVGYVRVTQERQVLNDDLIPQHEVGELHPGRSTGEGEIIQLVDGATAEGTVALLHRLIEANRYAAGDDRVGAFVLTDHEGRRLWGLDDGFLDEHGDCGYVEAAFWLAEQDGVSEWDISYGSSTPVISIDAAGPYAGLDFQRRVMERFGWARVSVAYPDAPRVNMVAGGVDLLRMTERLLAEWTGDPERYDIIDGLMVDDGEPGSGSVYDEPTVRVWLDADPPERRQYRELLIASGAELAPGFTIAF